MVLRFDDAVNEGDQLELTVMAGLVPAIHVFNAAKQVRRGCPAQGRT
jgi:hypothetical protein